MTGNCLATAAQRRIELFADGRLLAEALSGSTKFMRHELAEQFSALLREMERRQTFAKAR